MMQNMKNAMLEAYELEMKAFACITDDRPAEGLALAHTATLVRLEALEKSYLELASQFEAYKRAHEYMSEES